MASFSTFMAIPAIRQATEKSMFGKPYVRMGKLFTIVGYWVYQQGGLLGYVLREYPKLLIKLIIPQDASIAPEQAMQELYSIKEVVEKELENPENGEKTFFALYTVRELRQAGIELIKLPSDKALNNKVDFESASQIMRLAFIKGVTFGFHFPEQFTRCWDTSYRSVPDKEWAEASKLGIVPQKQRTISFSQAVCDLCEGAISWNNDESLKVLNSSDINILQNILSANK
jgi:hypothetical protein